MLDTEGPKFPTDWSSDGQFIAYSSQVPDYGNMHVWIVALSGQEEEAKPRPFLQHSYEEFTAHSFPRRTREEAPRWLAYTSHETGRYEVYVRDFPERPS